jgi:phage N-6-adenine-methyltransferase
MAKSSAISKVEFTHVDRGGTNAEWYTPPWIFERLQLQFDLDPCQPAGGLDWIPATRRYSIDDDGLKQVWHGKVWLNPPYGRDLSKWLSKMHEHRNGIALLPANTDTQWFHDYVSKAEGVFFIEGRVQFIDGKHRGQKKSPPAGSMLVAWGQDNTLKLLNLNGLGLFVFP